MRRFVGSARVRAAVVSLASMLVLLAGAGTAQATVPGGNGRIYYYNNYAIWSANPDGSGVQLLSQLGSPYGVSGNISVSPDGSKIAYSGNVGNQDGMYETDTTTGQTSLLTDPSQACDGDPSYSPDGTKVVFARSPGQPGVTGCAIVDPPQGSLVVMDRSTHATTQIASAGYFANTDWSPKGDKIAYVWSALNSSRQIVDELRISNTDGSGVKTLVQGYTNGPSFSPDGSRIAYGDGNGQVHVINADGTGDYVLTTGQHPFWSPDGTTIGFTALAGGGNISFIRADGSCPATSSFQTNPYRPAWAAGNSPMPPCGTGSASYAGLARRFEPVLRFDSSEKWRPLNVDDFLAEGRNLICDSNASPQCDPTPITSAADLARHATTTSYIKVYPGNFKTAGDEAQYHSPYAECTVNGLRDCDGGPRSAIYWGINDPTAASGYQYIDYWFFYRANYFYGKIDWHEGDWEGMTVAPSTTGQSFDYAAFSQHGKFWNYLPSVLRCEDTPASSIPAAGSCMSGGKTSGDRIDVMVANGSHANYTNPCSEQIFPIPHRCQQNGLPWPLNVERGYDGQMRWGNAFADPSTSLLPLPPSGAGQWMGNWTDWPGIWGQPKPSSLADVVEGGGPRSPGDQGFPFQCARIDNGPGCTSNPPRGGTLGPPASSGGGGGGGGVILTAKDARARTDSSPGLSALSCASWAGPGVGVAVCNPALLRAAIRAGRLNGRGLLSIRVVGVRGASVATRGITQYASTQPLGSGARLRLSGFLAGNDELFLRTFDPRHKHVLLLGFRVRHGRGALAAGRGTITLRLDVRADRRGHTAASLGGQAASSVQILS